MARLLIDESLPPLLAELLQANGIESDYAGDIGLAGRPDEDVYALAERLGAVLVTRDLDFSDIRHFPGDVGLVVLRLRHDMKRTALASLAAALIQKFLPDIETLAGKVMILESGRMRTRSKQDF